MLQLVQKCCTTYYWRKKSYCWWKKPWSHYLQRVLGTSQVLIPGFLDANNSYVQTRQPARGKSIFSQKIALDSVLPADSGNEKIRHPNVPTLPETNIKSPWKFQWLEDDSFPFLGGQKADFEGTFVSFQGCVHRSLPSRDNLPYRRLNPTLESLETTQKHWKMMGLVRRFWRNAYSIEIWETHIYIYMYIYVCIYIYKEKYKYMHIYIS